MISLPMPEFGDAFLARALELRGVLHRADADDRALAAHQPGHRMHGADGAGVGQRDRHAGEVLGGQLAVAGAPHDVLVGGDELAEPHRVGALDARHHQLTGAVLALQVDRQAEVGVRGRDGVRLPVDLGEVPVHVRELLDRLHDRVADQVGERDLAAAGPLEVVVDDDAVVDHQLGGDGAHARRGRHVQRRRHVLHDGGGRAAQYLRLIAVGGGWPSRPASVLPLWVWRVSRLTWRPAAASRPVVLPWRARARPSRAARRPTLAVGAVACCGLRRGRGARFARCGRCADDCGRRSLDVPVVDSGE